MEIIPTELDAVVLIQVDILTDERGFFGRTFDRQQFLDAGLEPDVEQTSLAFNHRAGTVRGMHYQDAPALEAKLVRCVRGALVDVVVDLRPGSATLLRHVSVELNADNRLALYIPPLCAHGYQTLMDGTEVSYQMNAPYSPALARGIRHDDPALGITWPLPVTVISKKDRQWPLLS